MASNNGNKTTLIDSLIRSISKQQNNTVNTKKNSNTDKYIHFKYTGKTAEEIGKIFKQPAYNKYF